MNDAFFSVAAEQPAAIVDLKPVRPFYAAPRQFLGVPVHCWTLAQTITAVEQAIEQRQPLQHVCINVAKFVAMRANEELAGDVRSSHVVSVDGMGIVWGARLLGVDVPERVTGVDLMEGVLALCAAKGFRPYFLGATPAVVEAAVENMRRRHPTLVFAGWHHGYFKREEEDGIVDAITASGADCLVIGVPTPKKERFMARHRATLSVPFVMGIGGAFDVLAGIVRRAPPLVQRLGLEWLFRMVQEPRRLGPRYMKSNLAYAAILTRALVAKHLTIRR